MSSLADARDDAVLLAAHRAGDPAAFGVLFARHRDRLYAVALRTAGDPELAADALQDAMVSAFRRAETFRGDAAVTTWLHRIVVNAVLDLHRRQAVRAAEPLEDADGTERLDRRPAADRDEDPAQRLVDAERRAELLDALRRIPPGQRAAVVLVDVEGWSVADAAEVLGCAPGTVKSRCSRGRARLGELLGNRPSSRRVPSADGGRTQQVRDDREEGSP